MTLFLLLDALCSVIAPGALLAFLLMLKRVMYLP